MLTAIGFTTNRPFLTGFGLENSEALLGFVFLFCLWWKSLWRGEERTSSFDTSNQNNIDSEAVISVDSVFPIYRKNERSSMIPAFATDLTTPETAAMRIYLGSLDHLGSTDHIAKSFQSSIATILGLATTNVMLFPRS